MTQIAFPNRRMSSIQMSAEYVNPGTSRRIEKQGKSIIHNGNWQTGL